MAAGRPKKYTKKGLREAIERYFRSISRTIPARDDTGGIIRTGVTAAVSVLLMLPPIVIFLICQNSVVETMAYSGIKS